MKLVILIILWNYRTMENCLMELIKQWTTRWSRWFMKMCTNIEALDNRSRKFWSHLTIAESIHRSLTLYVVFRRSTLRCILCWILFWCSPWINSWGSVGIKLIRSLWVHENCSSSSFVGINVPEVLRNIAVWLRVIRT